MERSNVVRVLLGCLLLGSVIATGCKKDEDPATVPVPSASQAAEAPPPPSAEPAATASATEAPTAAPQPVAATTPTARKGESIDSCCSALKAVQKSGKTAIAKSKAAAAAGVCPGVAKLVKDGTITRSAGLAQIRTSLSGFDVPGECR